MPVLCNAIKGHPDMVGTIDAAAEESDQAPWQMLPRWVRTFNASLLAIIVQNPGECRQLYLVGGCHVRSSSSDNGIIRFRQWIVSHSAKEPELDVCVSPARGILPLEDEQDRTPSVPDNSIVRRLVREAHITEEQARELIALLGYDWRSLNPGGTLPDREALVKYGSRSEP